MRQEFADVEADAAGADDRDAAPGLPPSHDDIDVACDFGMVDPRDRRRARHDAGREHDVIETPRGPAPSTRRPSRNDTPVVSIRRRK